MQEREKQIEEIARIICRDYNGGICATDGFVCNYNCEWTQIAKHLYNAGYRKQSEWISVEERLPSEDEQRDEYGELVPFLVCEKDTKYPYRAFYDGTIWGDGLMKIKGITHWMPLPEAPTEKGGGQ